MVEQNNQCKTVEQKLNKKCKMAEQKNARRNDRLNEVRQNIVAGAALQWLFYVKRVLR
jgi:hypothetical protein